MSAHSLNAVAVFCGSSPGKDPAHLDAASALGTEIAARGLKLVYGGGGLGLMGATARAAKNAGGSVLGVIPKLLKKVEATLEDIDHILVDDMHERKIRMYEASDAFIILPGGIGTLEEAIEVLSWQQLNLHEKPILFLSINGYWDNLIREFDRIIEAGFAAPSFADNVLIARSIPEAFDVIHERLENPIYRAPLVLRDVSVGDLA